MEQIQENEQWKLNGNCEKCNFSGNKDENIVIFLGDFGLVWNVEKVKLLKEICDKSNAKVVISSSLRGSENCIPKIYYILRDILKNNGIENKEYFCRGKLIKGNQFSPIPDKVITINHFATK